MKKNKEVRAVIYARANSDTEKGWCIGCQISECLEYCDSHSFTVVGGHFDIGSTMAINRPGLDAIYDLLLSELVDVLVVTSLDRIFRTRNEALEFAELLHESGVTVHVSDLGPKENNPLSEAVTAGMRALETKVRSQKARAAAKKKTSKSNKVKVIPNLSKKK